jgi:hypothetical protein
MPERPDPSVAAVLAALAAGAAAIHLAMVPMHAQEWLLLGIAFAVVGWAQAALAVAVVVAPRRWLLPAGIALSVAAVGAWAVSRTTGFPFGPEAGVPEEASTIDLLCVGLEVLFAAGAAYAMRARPVPGRRPLAAGVATVAVLAVAGFTTAALATPSGAHEHGEAHEHAVAATGEADHADDGHDHARELAVAAGESAAAAEIAADETSAGHEHGHGVVPNVPVDAATRAALASELVEARAVALSYPTVADAEAAGYTMVTPYVPLIGAHYIKWSAMDGTFDVAEPEMLLYDGTDPASAMVGLSYYQFSPTEPAGFAGPNDHWHQHIGLCLNAQLVVVGGSSTSAEECAARGGRKIEAADGWMVHAWVVPGWESQEGVFSPENPDLR